MNTPAPPINAGQKRLRTASRQRTNRTARKTSFALLIAAGTFVFSTTSTRAFHLLRPLSSPILYSATPIETTPSNDSTRLNKNKNNRIIAVLQSNRSPSSLSSTTCTKISSATSSSVVVEAVQPLRPDSSTSKERRDAVLRAPTKTKRSVDSALEGIDAQVLELLSEEFLYPLSLLYQK